MASSSSMFVWLLMVAAAATAQVPDSTEVTTDLPTVTPPEALPTLPKGCFTPETHPDCFSASDITASVIGTFFLTVALGLILYALHRLCWRVYNTKLANYAI